MNIGNWFEMDDAAAWGSVATVCVLLLLIFGVGPCVQNLDTVRYRQDANEQLLRSQGFRKLEDGTWIKPTPEVAPNAK